MKKTGDETLDLAGAFAFAAFLAGIVEGLGVGVGPVEKGAGEVDVGAGAGDASAHDGAAHPSLDDVDVVDVHAVGRDHREPRVVGDVAFVVGGGRIEEGRRHGDDGEVVAVDDEFALGVGDFAGGAVEGGDIDFDDAAGEFAGGVHGVESAGGAGGAFEGVLGDFGDGFGLVGLHLVAVELDGGGGGDVAGGVDDGDGALEGRFLVVGHDEEDGDERQNHHDGDADDGEEEGLGEDGVGEVAPGDGGDLKHGSVPPAPGPRLHRHRPVGRGE